MLLGYICEVLINQTQIEKVLIVETREAFLDNRGDDVVQVQFFDLIPFVEAGSHARSIQTKIVIRILTFFSLSLLNQDNLIRILLDIYQLCYFSRWSLTGCWVRSELV
jgi:hypothetical protein